MANYNPQMGYPTTGQAPIATQYPYGVNNYSNILTKAPIATQYPYGVNNYSNILTKQPY